MQFPVSSSMYELSHLRQIPLESRAVHGEEDVNITAVSVAIISIDIRTKRDFDKLIG